MQWGKSIFLGVYIILLYLMPLISSLPPIAHLLSSKNASAVVPQGTDTYFKQYIAMMRAGDIQKAYPLLPDQAQAVVSSSTLLSVSQMLANTSGQPTFVGYSLNYDEGPSGLGTVRDGVYELENNDQQYHYYNYVLGAVRRLVGIEVGVVSGVFNLESPGVDAPGWRLRHEEAYHAA